MNFSYAVERERACPADFRTPSAHDVVRFDIPFHAFFLNSTIIVPIIRLGSACEALTRSTEFEAVGDVFRFLPTSASALFRQLYPNLPGRMQCFCPPEYVEAVLFLFVVIKPRNHPFTVIHTTTRSTELSCG